MTFFVTLAVSALAVPAIAIPPLGGLRFAQRKAETTPTSTVTGPTSAGFGPSSSSPSISAPTLVTSVPNTPAISYFTGTPTITGALKASSIGSGISGLPLNPAATAYIPNGTLHRPEPAPYVPAGGIGTNGTVPVYNVRSDYDFESLALALYQAYAEINVLEAGLRLFSDADLKAAGLLPADRILIETMVKQKAGHATMLTEVLGRSAPKMCTYHVPFTTVYEFLDFSQKLMAVDVASAEGIAPHLNSREAAMLLMLSTCTTARTQTVLRQLEGLSPVPDWFATAIPQSWAWTLVAPYISSCPANQTRLAWQNFPPLWILTQPNPARKNASAGFNETMGAGLNALNNTGYPPVYNCDNGTIPKGTMSSGACGSTPSPSAPSLSSCNGAIAPNRSMPLSHPGEKVWFEWGGHEQPVGPNNSYVTLSLAKLPKYVAWVSQLNVTYTELTMSNSTFGYTVHPRAYTYMGDPSINGTMFVALTDSNPKLTPFNLSMINPHVVAGPAVYQAG